MEALAELSLVHSTINKIKKSRDKINGEVSRIEKDVNDHYHVLELLELNGAEMMKITVSLRKLLKQRRDLKEQQILVNNFLTGNVESVKDPAFAAKNANTRESKYTNEALQSYERIMGKKKKLVGSPS